MGPNIEYKGGKLMSDVAKMANSAIYVVETHRTGTLSSALSTKDQDFDLLEELLGK